MMTPKTKTWVFVGGIGLVAMTVASLVQTAPWALILAGVVLAGVAIAVLTGKVGREWPRGRALAILIGAVLLALVGVGGIRTAAKQREAAQREHEARITQTRKNQFAQDAAKAAERDERQKNVERAAISIIEDFSALSRQAGEIAIDLKTKRYTKARQELAPMSDRFAPLKNVTMNTNNGDERSEKTLRKVELLRDQVLALQSDLETVEGRIFDATYSAAFDEQGEAKCELVSAFKEVGRKLAVPAAEVSAVFSKREAEANRRREGAARLQAVALTAKCGQKPMQVGEQGFIAEVKLYVQSIANDPESIDLEQCSPIRLTRDCWVTNCKFRGRNAFGGKVLNFARFYLKNERVLRMESR